ncbi:MAG: tRNA (adenosine(37)-N6)-dimethylallyltransferase MiaA [Candidatus Margulisiibacteriota bacterium]|nr:tRNA (adenosine(37)-N6)-dimethylallyltransferase MiaA [Candidatus Margulisiibacteriota bacterium]
MKQISVIIGPTASGKSAFSLNLAKQTNCDIISADAYQIYKGFNIGTGTLSDEEMGSIKHYLINEKSPNEEYSVQEFIQSAERIMAKNNNIIICGGSAMYLKALLYGYTPLKRLPPDERPNGEPKDLWNQLNAIDPQLAIKTPYQNKNRVQRYLELYSIYNQPPSTLFKSQEFDSKKFKVIGLLIENTVLKERISERVDGMIQQGLVDEVRYLMEKYDINAQAFQGIGYKEVIQFLTNKIDYNDMVHLIKKNSYQYAKRQMTWFKAFDHVQWISKK